MAAVDLYVTKTRLKLLRLIDAGVVQHDPATSQSYCTVSGETLTAAVKEMERAGWVTLYGGPVELTGLGDDKLTEADR